MTIRKRIARFACWGWLAVSNIRLDQLASTINNSLNLYATNILKGIDQAAETAVSEMVQTTKQRPTKDPRATGKYARSHASQPGEQSLTSRSRIWYVKGSSAALAHLLNNGHRSRRNGHVSGDSHIANAANTAMQRFENEVREVIRREST